jgi:hypothetical protein
MTSRARTSALSLAVGGLLLLSGCTGPSYDTALREDTIEAYKAFLEANPGSSMELPAKKRLEELFFEQAQKEGTAEAWELYLTEFPEGGPHYAEALKAATGSAWKRAFSDGSVDALKAFLDKYGKGDRMVTDRARGLLAAKEYGKLEVSEPRVQKVNLAEDPKGELNGWGVFVDVTNAGTSTLPYVRLSVDWRGADGASYGTRDYPLTAKVWTLPATDEQQTPMKAGEKRVWAWTEDFAKVPADAQPAATVYVSGFKAE